MKNLYNKNGGFTLIETLVAISIFTMSILGLMVILTQSISSTTYAKQKLIASYLAQEGIEYVRNMRDTFMLYPDSGASSLDGGAGGYVNEFTPQDSWANFNYKLSSSSCNTNTGCYFDAPNLFSSGPRPAVYVTYTPCTGLCPFMSYDASNGQYQYTTGSTSGFRRKIKAVQLGANETQISSTVSWSQGSGAYSVTFSENLFGWIQ